MKNLSMRQHERFNNVKGACRNDSTQGGGVANLWRKEGRLREPYTINTDKEEEGGEAEIPKI